MPMSGQPKKKKPPVRRLRAGGLGVSYRASSVSLVTRLELGSLLSESPRWFGVGLWSAAAAKRPRGVVRFHRHLLQCPAVGAVNPKDAEVPSHAQALTRSVAGAPVRSDSVHCPPEGCVLPCLDIDGYGTRGWF